MPGTVLSLGDLAVNEVKNDILASELTFYLVEEKIINKKTNKYVILCLVMKKKHYQGHREDHFKSNDPGRPLCDDI